MPHVTLTGFGGAQQTAIAAAFKNAGWTVIGTSRTARSGVHAADLATGEGLDEALAGADLLVFTLPQDRRPGSTPGMARTLAQAARRTPRVILNAAARIVDAILRCSPTWPPFATPCRTCR